MQWLKTLPTVNGIYWFDSGFASSESISMILQVRGESYHVYGDGGSGPLRMFYLPAKMKKARFGIIDQPEKWQDISAIKERRSRGWIRDAKGNFGFAILNPSGTGSCDIIWTNHPVDGAVCSIFLRSEDNYKIGLVNIPKR